MSTQMDHISGQRTAKGKAFEGALAHVGRKIDAFRNAANFGPQALAELCKKDPEVEELRYLNERLVATPSKKELLPADVAHLEILRNLLVAYKNDEFIGLEVMPTINTNNQVYGEYWLYNKTDRTAYPDDTFGQNGRGEVAELTQARESTTYSLIERAFKERLSWLTVQNQAVVLDELLEIVINVLYGLSFRRELRISGKVFGASNYASTNKVTIAAGDDRWNDGRGDPMGVLEDARAAVWSGAGDGEMVLVVGRAVWKALKFHPQLLDKIVGGATLTNRAMLNQQAVADLLEVDRVLVGSARQNTGTDASPTYGRIWTTTSAALVRVAKRPTPQNASFGYTFQAYAPKQDLFWYPDHGASGEYVARASVLEDSLVVAPDTSYHITTAVD